MTQIAPSLLLIAWLFQSLGRAAEKPLVLPVWPGKLPEDFGMIGAERVRARVDRDLGKNCMLAGCGKPSIR